MRLVHLEIRVDFAEEIQEYLLDQKVYKAITGKKPRELEQKLKQPVLIQSPKRKQAVRWDTESCGIVLEQSPSINYFIDVAIPLLDRINVVAPIGNIGGRRFITYWLLSAPNYDFGALEHKYRETMIAQKPICQGTVDSSIILDISTSAGTLHHQSGAMGIKQLSDDYLLFKLDDVPKVCLFLWASIEEEKVVEYSPEGMHNFLANSFDVCKSHSDAFERIWEEVL